MARIKVYSQEELDLRREMYIRKRYPNRGKLKTPLNSTRRKLHVQRMKEISHSLQGCIPTTIKGLRDMELLLNLSAPFYENLLIEDRGFALKIRARHIEVISKMAEIEIPNPQGGEKVYVPFE